MFDNPDLFAAAGMVLDEALCPKPKRRRKPTPPTLAERAAADRLRGGRHSRPTPRDRVGPARLISPGEIAAFPFSRHRELFAEILGRLPHGYDDQLDARCDRETRNLESRLIRRGLPKQIARKCARELLDCAYIKRVDDAHKEAGVL